MLVTCLWAIMMIPALLLYCMFGKNLIMEKDETL